MTKTLADMTEEERAECVGMWAETSNGLGIIIEPFYTDGVLDTTVVFSLKPEVKIEQRIAAYTAPRYDLPRAWAPDGAPPQGEWEYTECLGMTGEYTCRRRWVGEWGLE
ncbi:hypothetical protein [Corynebacterium marquesiae]|uniref:hypothetical protein n=1 Tax=Corynebacterium marquesiae TaxID=2913503 RepID=UPI0022BA723C|nr:hypothetical protein [Corynebacterium marquesiae]MCZ9300502.1 hypothetical protein [Corynebacterium marquesiae]